MFIEGSWEEKNHFGDGLSNDGRILVKRVCGVKNFGVEWVDWSGVGGLWMDWSGLKREWSGEESGERKQTSRA